MNLALFLAPLVVLTRLAAVIFFAPLASFACEFHHDGSLLTEFDPDSEEFITKVEKAEKDCEDTELAVSGNCTIDLETGSVSGEKCSSDEAFEAPVFTSTGTIEKDVPVRGSNNTNKMSANWARFPFTRGALPPKFADKQKLRAATGAYISQEQGEGAGARVRRSIGRPELRNVDPFLMLDEFKVGLPAGFPDHPHRGMETVTYMLPDTPGKMTHEDSKGNAGTLAGQDLQWMTAAKGIMHSEVPETQAEAHGLQMWINLPRTEKMKKPEYQEVRADKLARAEAEDETGKKVQCAIAAGEALGIQSSVRTRTPTIFVHVNVLEKGGTFRQVIPKNFTGFLYTLGGCEITVVGDGKTADRDVGAHTTVPLQSNGKPDDDKQGVEIVARRPEANFMVVAAEPIGEPIVQYGPFVMTSNAEIQDAFRDYQTGRNGFEGASQWKSKNSERMGRGGR